jgi:hypothetical protein
MVLFQIEKYVVAVNSAVITVETRHARCTDLSEIGRKKLVSELRSKGRMLVLISIRIGPTTDPESVTAPRSGAHSQVNGMWPPSCSATLNRRWGPGHTERDSPPCLFPT